MMKTPTRPTSPDEEGIELYPDSWKRFERTLDKVINAPPVHRTGKPTGGDRLKRKGVPRGPAKPIR
jgi:hypothetical protein